MLFCTRCRIALEEAVNRDFRKCLAPANMRSIANELAERHNDWVLEEICKGFVSKRIDRPKEPA
jgi:hypothetical protein